MSDDNDFSTHRRSITNALESIGKGVGDLRGELARMTREMDTATARLVTRVDDLAAWKAEAEKRLRDLESNASKSTVYVAVGSTLLAVVASIVVSVIARAVSR